MKTKRALTAVLLLSAGALALPGAAAAAYPGANGYVAFTSTQDGGARHIFLERAGSVVDLTGTWSMGAETQPRFSPDGREILFTGLEHGRPNAELFVMGADGSARTQITNTPEGNSDATWSPDGTQIAFVSERDSQVPNIYIMRSDGTHVRQITHDTSGKSQLDWSPKGDRIAFVRTPAGGGDRDIYSIRTDGSGLTDLTNDPSSPDLEPAWSPDGTEIVYSGPLHRGESVGMDLWIMNADGSGSHELFHENNKYSDGAYPAWSPDGTTIAFTANNGSGYYHVWLVPVSGGQNSELITNTVPGGNPVDAEVDWQPAAVVSSPRTILTAGRVREHSAVFSFDATGPATGYRCMLRRGNHRASFAPCGPSKTYPRLKPGRYTFSVTAVGPDEPYHTPAKRTFTIR
ncbi:MAG TPA: DPP IV N-terminal domain-containing protein [Solirubrobacteraceae bacterium]|nr:DPP IV N-terminal domain-containing protein [Solirubrobacteraceae bacterium]